MVLSEEDVAALRADLGRVLRETEATRVQRERKPLRRKIGNMG